MIASQYRDVCSVCETGFLGFCWLFTRRHYSASALTDANDMRFFAVDDVVHQSQRVDRVPDRDARTRQANSHAASNRTDVVADVDQDPGPIFDVDDLPAISVRWRVERAERVLAIRDTGHVFLIVLPGTFHRPERVVLEFQQPSVSSGP